jgi:small-conductance mechanosensitive channel
VNQGYLYELLRKLGLSDFGARTVQFIVVRPLKIVLILAAAVVLGRLAARAVRRLLKGAQQRAPIRPSSPRAQQRAETIADVLAGLLKAAILVIAAFMALGELGVNLAPLIAGAGIAGIAVGFGAQSLVKDFLSGIFLLVEDQYGVGDVIDTGEAIGTVEDVTLRVTRLRDGNGVVWYVRNGEIIRVGNRSQGWSTAIVDLPVAYTEDAERVQGIIRVALRQMDEDPAWHDKLVECPTVVGIEQITGSTMTIRVIAKCEPNENLSVQREIRERAKTAFDQHGVKAPVTFPPFGGGPAAPKVT